jgi:hypothetical protein
MFRQISPYIPAKWTEALRRRIYLPKFAAKRVLARQAAARKIKRIDDRGIPLARTEIRAFMIVRNEGLRLPFMLRHYFERGVDSTLSSSLTPWRPTGATIFSRRQMTPCLPHHGRSLILEASVKSRKWASSVRTA